MPAITGRTAHITVYLSLVAVVAIASGASAQENAAVGGTGRLMTQELRLNGEGTMVAAPVLIELRNATNPSPQAALITAKKAVLVRYTDVRIGLDDPVIENVQTLPRPETVGEFENVEFRLADVSQSTVFTIRCHGFLETAFEFDGGLTLMPAPDDRVGASLKPTGEDLPREEFDVPPNGLARLVQNNSVAAFAGSFNVLIEQASFRITAAGDTETFSTERWHQQAGTSSAWTQTWYTLRVEEGSYHAAAIQGNLMLRAETFELHHTGSLNLHQASGRILYPDVVRSIEGQDIDLAGTLTATSSSVKKSDGAYALRFDFDQVSSEAAPEGGKALSFGANAWWPFTGIFGAFFLVGAALYGWRHVPILRATPMPAAEKPAPASQQKARATSLALMENTFRDNPENVQAAIELGLTYGRAGRHEEALPLLLLSIQSFPKVEALRYQAALGLLAIGRDEDAATHLEYAFRLNPLNVARFLKEGPARAHGQKPPIAGLLRRWSRNFHESSNRGYA